MMRQTISYPPTVENGDLKLSREVDCDFEAIAAVLETRPMERIMRPYTFGYEPDLFRPIPNADIPAYRIEVTLLDQIPQLVECLCRGSFVEERGELQVPIYFRSISGEAKTSMVIGGVIVG
jgi:hypothetical protein